MSATDQDYRSGYRGGQIIDGKPYSVIPFEEYMELNRKIGFLVGALRGISYHLDDHGKKLVENALKHIGEAE